MIAVSIIVPVYNTEEYLQKCLDSLTNQTLKDIEIICINDGSTDNSLKILEENANKDERIKILNQENKLQGAARNAGMEIARGEYIGFVDSDDWVDLNYFEELYNAATKYNSEIAFCTTVRIGNGKTKKRQNIAEEVYYRDLQTKFDACALAKNPCPTNKIYKRELLMKNNIKWPEGCYCEDKLFVTQAIYYTNGVVAVPSVNYYYFRNPSSTVKSKTKKRIRKLVNDKNNAKLAVLNFLKEKNPDIRDKDFWAITDECKILNILIYQIKSSLKTEKICLFGLIPIAEICDTTDYKRKRVNILGIKLTYKTHDWKAKANEQNILLNKNNLSLGVKAENRSILYVATNFVKAGGIETRLLQYIKELRSYGWDAYILSEYNENKQLSELTNFKLNFDGVNFGKCLEEIIDKYGINTVEFQFKNPKILKNIDLEKLKSKVKLGCTIHNLGIEDIGIINKFDYKVIVSKYMYENHYMAIKNAVVIPNGINTDEYKDLKCWKYIGQKKAVLISRINKDKIKSIECFIKYCKMMNVQFEIAGDEKSGSGLINKLINKYKLSKEQFIGGVKTLEYLDAHTDEILFVGGVGLVILEAAYLNYPCLCCSDWKGANYSFVTNSNVDLFDNFTIRNQSLVTLKGKKEHKFDFEKLSNYGVRSHIISNRNFSVSLKKYLEVIEGNIC